MSSQNLTSAVHCNVCLTLKAAVADNPNLEMSQQDELITTDKLTIPFILKTCSRCSLVVYCSINHQKMDWPAHRKFCQAVSKIMQMYDVKNPFQILNREGPRTAKEMENVIKKLKCLLRHTLHRPLEASENELITFPMYCKICFQIRPIRTCGNCMATAYCSEAHGKEDEEKHRQICHQMKLYYCPYKMIAQPMLEVNFKQHIDTLNSMNMVTAFSKATAIPVSKDITTKLNSFIGDFSCIATICYVMEIFFMGIVYNSKTFNIYILGATVESLVWFKDIHTRFFFLQNQNILHLNLYFIGPEIEELKERTTIYEFLNTNRTITYTFYKGLFQDLKTQGNDLQPSLVVAFNCGFAEFPSANSSAWHNGIKKMIEFFEIPIVFTSFTKSEAQQDKKVFLNAANNTNINTEYIIDIQLNPYHDLRPLRNWELSDIDDEIFYRNGYIQTVRTRSN